MKKKLYLHMGLVKTGTSFLQATFASNEVNYKNNGLLYPDISNNHEIAITGMTTSGNGMCISKKYKEKPDFKKKRDAINSNFDEISFFSSLDENNDYLISSEGLNNVPIQKIIDFAKVISQKHELHLIYFYRSIPDLIISRYLQRLKHGNKKSFVDSLDELKIEVRKTISRLIEKTEIGINFSVFSYDCSRNLINDVDKLIFGRDISVPFKGVKGSIVNPTPNLHQIEVLSLIANLDITNYKLNMEYIENTATKGGAKFSIDKVLAESIENEFEDQINQFNKVSAKGHVYIPYKKFKASSLNNQPLSLNSEDMNHIINSLKSNPVKRSIKKSLKYLEQFMSLPKNPQLPEDFNSINYLILNPELITREVDPEEHYLKLGRDQGKRYKKIDIA